jgi:uncharacterized protein YndB with AHSA1/START domain
MERKSERPVITVSTIVNASPEKVWELFTGPQHIIRWNHALDSWLTSYAENDVRTGGAFLSRMEARDGSAGFDFSGQYSEVIPGKSIAYTLGDDRRVSITFSDTAGGTLITESFEAEDQNSTELQRTGWQAILDSFKKYAGDYAKNEMLHFEIVIDNSPGNIFRLMIEDKGFRKWTSVFNAESRFSGSWEKGGEIMFLGTEADGSTGGMVCRIRENIPGKFLSIESLGEIVDGREASTYDNDSAWNGSLENYSLKPEGDRTLLCVDTDVPPDFRPYFTETWPKALQKLKELCEQASR